MNTNVKVLIGATIGGALGWFVGAVIADYIQAKEDLKNGDLEWVEEEETEEDDRYDQFKDKEMYKRPEKMVTKRSTKRNYTEYFKSQGRPDLATLAARYNGDELEVPTTTQDEVGGVARPLEDGEFEYPAEEVEEKDISIIPLSEYANDTSGFEALTLNYYDDDVVTDEHDNPIERPEQLLGEDALVSFGELSEDEDVVYVRNLSKKAMYEVVRLNKPYAAERPRRLTQSNRRPVEKEEDYGEDST